MPPNEQDAALLWDMLAAARLVNEFVAGHTLDDYVHGQLLQAAVERKIEIIGEAACTSSINRLLMIVPV